MLGCATMGRCVGAGNCGAAVAVAVSCSTEGRCATVRERPDGGASDAAARDVGLDGG